MKIRFIGFLILISAFLTLFLACKSSKVEKENSDEGLLVENDYTGWGSGPSKVVSYDSGIVGVQSKIKKGTFLINVRGESGKKVPVLSTVNESTSSSFYLKFNNKIIKLQGDGNISSEALRKENRLEIAYKIPKTADVTLTFEGLSSVAERETDMLKVCVKVENTYGKLAEYSLKAILDTVLGESERNHFYTYGNTPVNSEVVYRTMKKQKWVISKNKNYAIQILLDGADITVPECVMLSAFNTLNSRIWEPSVNSNKSFDNVLSYNNSAVGINWASVKLEAGQSFSVIFYLAFGVDGATPQGEAFISPKTVDRNSEPVVPAFMDAEKLSDNTAEGTNEAVPDENSDFVPESYAEPVLQPENSAQSQKPAQNQKSENSDSLYDSNKILPEPSVSKDGNSKIYPSAAVKNNSKLRYDVNSLSREQLTPGYVQTLLDRIIALEEDGTGHNQDEILQLNAELDAILSVLRQ